MQLQPVRCVQAPRYGARGSRPYFFVSLLYISSRHCHTNHAATFSHHTSFHETNNETVTDLGAASDLLRLRAEDFHHLRYLRRLRKG